VKVLADDSMEGRETGSEGLRWAGTASAVAPPQWNKDSFFRRYAATD